MELVEWKPVLGKPGRRRTIDNKDQIQTLHHIHSVWATLLQVGPDRTVGFSYRRDASNRRRVLEEGDT